MIYKDAVSPQAINAWNNNSLVIAYNTDSAVDHKIEKATKGAVYNIYVGESVVDAYSFTTASAAKYVYKDEEATNASFIFTDNDAEYEPHKPYTGPGLNTITITTPALEGRIVKASYYTTSDLYYTTVAIVCDGKPVKLYSGATSQGWKDISWDLGHKTGAQANILFETDDPTVQINEQWTWLTETDLKNGHTELLFATKPGVQSYKIVVDDCITTPFTFTVNNVEYISTKVSFLTMSDGHIVQPGKYFEYTKSLSDLGLSGAEDVRVINYAPKYYYNSKKGSSEVTITTEGGVKMSGTASKMGATKTAWKHNSFTLAYKNNGSSGSYTYSDANGGYQYNIYDGNPEGTAEKKITRGSFVLPNKTTLNPPGASGQEAIYVYEKMEGGKKVFHLTNKPYELMGATVEPKFERIYASSTQQAIEFLTSENALDVTAYYGMKSLVTFVAIEAKNGDYSEDKDTEDRWKIYGLTQAAANADPGRRQYTFAAFDAFGGEVTDTTTKVSILIRFNDPESIGLTTVTAEAIVYIATGAEIYAAKDGKGNAIATGVASKFDDASQFVQLADGVYGAVSYHGTYKNQGYQFESATSDLNLGKRDQTGNKTYTVEYKPYVTYASVSADFQYVLSSGATGFVSYNALTTAAFTQAGLYKVTERVNYVTDKEDDTTTAAFFYKTFYFVIDQADLDIKQAVDTVYTNTKLQNHTFRRNVAGMNGETVYGEFTFAAENSDGWGNAEDRSAGPSTPLQTGIEWEFNVYETTYNGGSGDGRKNLNNYLDQFDGPSAETSASGDVQNSYYKGSNGVLSYSQNGAYVREADMTLNMVVSGAPVVKATSDSAVATCYGIFAEYITIGGVIGNEHELGYRVVSGDAISGNTEFGTKISDSSVLPEGYRDYFDDLVSTDAVNNRYKGDLYVITVKAGSDTIKTIKYTDQTATKSVNNVASVLTDKAFNDLPACEYYGIDAYEVEIKYIGLYYTSNTGDDKRDPAWQGGEEFNWVVSELRFPLDIEQREIVLTSISGINKIYDGKTELVKQTMTGVDVTGAEKYIIDVENLEGNNSQFAMTPGVLFDNYADPSNGAEDHMAIELAGNYSDANKGAEKNVTITAARLLHYENISGSATMVPANGDKVAALNYKLVTSDAAEFTGTISVAAMHFTHDKYGTMLVYNDKPMHDMFGIHATAYLLTVSTTGAGFYDTLTMTDTELVERDDATKDTAFKTSEAAFDYAVSYSIIKDDTKYGPNFNDPDLKINEETGAVEKVSVKSIGGEDPEVFPAMKITVTSFGNFTLVPGTENSETNIFNTCTKSGAATNNASVSNETWTHDVRFRIIGNNNSYDLLIPVNQLNKRVSESAFINRTGGRVSVGSEYYDYVTVYPNGDEVTFSFTIPQNSYLEDVKIFDVKKVASVPAFEVLLASGTAIGSFSDQATAGGLNNIANPLFLTLDKVNGQSLATQTFRGSFFAGPGGYSYNKLAAANLQIGGSKFEFTFKAGSCSLGANYAIAIVPVIKPIGKLITDGAFTVTDDAINVSFSAIRDFSGTAEVESDVYGKLVFTVSGAAAEFSTTWGAITREGDYIIPVKTASYAAFFDPEKLLAGTEVKISLDVWRDGALSGVQTDSAVDADIFDKIELTWTVSEDDYDTLFADETVQFYDGETFLGYGIISAGTIDFANVTFVAAEANPTAELKNFTNYTKTDYTFNAWCTDAGLTNPVVYNVGTSIAAVFGGDVFYLKATYTPPYTPGPSGSSTPKSYEITLEDVENGSVSTDKTSAVKGETVVLTLTPNDGYEVLAFIVLDKNGKEIETKDLGNGSYSFEMPASKVNIKSAFEKKVKTFFVDVPADAYFYEPVFWAADCGITDGVDETHFAPDLGVKRAQVVTFLWRTAGKPEPAGTAPVFTDVVSGSYYEKAVAWAYEQGITKGTTETTFSPEETCLRGQVAAFLARFAGVMDTDTASVFSDVKSTDYFAAAVKWAKDNKITDGTSTTTFSPKLECTRGQIVTFLYRYVMR